MNQLPDPNTEAVTMWLKSLRRADLRTQGWIQVNRQFHGIAMAMRPYLDETFPDPEQRAAAFDGLVAGLMTLGHFKDVTDLGHLFEASVSNPAATPKSNLTQ